MARAESEPFILNDEPSELNEEDLLDGGVAARPQSASRSLWFSCGLLETRFCFTLGSFLILALYWGQQPVIALSFLIAFTAFALVVLVRILLIARFQPSLLLNARQAQALSELNDGAPALRMNRAIDLNAASFNINPTHLRLALLDRDFTPNDYEMLLALDEEMRAQQFTGIPQSLIERLPTFTVPPRRESSATSLSLTSPTDAGTDTGSSATPGGKNSSETMDDSHMCAVCLEPKLPGDILRVLPCLHSFHAGTCIDPWLRSTPSCPICKFTAHLD